MDYYGNDNGNQNGGYSHDPFASEMAPPFKAPAFRGQTLTGEVPGGKSPESP